MTRNIFFLFAFALMAFASKAQSYISSNEVITFEEKIIKSYASPNIYLRGDYNSQDSTWRLLLTIVETSFDADFAGDEYRIVFTKAEVDEFTGTGTGDTEKIENALQQCLINYLEGINTTTTFTIN